MTKTCILQPLKRLNFRFLFKSTKCSSPNSGKIVPDLTGSKSILPDEKTQQFHAVYIFQRIRDQSNQSMQYADIKPMT